MSIVAIIGSHYRSAVIAGFPLEKKMVSTVLGEQAVYRFPSARECYVIFRHGLPYCYLPHEIPYQLQALALSELQCESLLLTSSVGLLDEHLPLFKPLVVKDLIMLDNRLPNGDICTLNGISKKLTHLVFRQGPFSKMLNQQIESYLRQKKHNHHQVIYAYFPGPRTKTFSENGFFSQMGAQVNSMTLGPEIVLANELAIPTAALVVGHKHSLAKLSTLEAKDLQNSLLLSKQELEQGIIWFFENIQPPPFENFLYTIE